MRRVALGEESDIELDATVGSSPTSAGPEASSRLENVLEHLFIGELLRCLWGQGHRDVEILRAEVDAFGYDLVVETGGVLRHIQLKASHREGKRANVDIGLALAEKPSGCVIWLVYDPVTLSLGPFRWFGGKPGEKLPPLGDKVVRHSKGDATGLKAIRPNLRKVEKGRFETLPTLNVLVDRLFGLAPKPMTLSPVADIGGAKSHASA